VNSEPVLSAGNPATVSIAAVGSASNQSRRRNAPGLSLPTHAPAVVVAAWRRRRPITHSALASIAAARWLTIGVLLLLSLVDPAPGPTGLPDWTLMLFFAAYNLLVDLARASRGWLRPSPSTVFLDLLVAGGLYLLAARPDGPLSTLLFLTAVSAAATLSRGGVVLFTIVAMTVIGVAEVNARPALPFALAVSLAGGQMLQLALVAFGTALLMRRLAFQHVAARQARHEAEHFAELDRLRANFVAAISHDLQTPLTAVRAGLGMLETSASDRLHDDEAHLLANARRNTERLGLQINDLLSLNQLEAGIFSVDPAPLDLRSVVASVVAVVHPLATQKGQELQVDVDRPLMVAGDRRRLDHALLNIVVNAHRHTPRGTRIAITGRHTPRGVLLQVADDGPGIPSHARDRVFQRFYRLDDGSSRSGLGLTIAKAAIERHGGQIWIEAAGPGTTLAILLPALGEPERTCL
jgi:signal transduction histidine kinase